MQCCRNVRFESVVSLILLILTGTASADPVPDYNFTWRTIGDPGNPPYEGGPGGQLAGRGSVDYLYRMSQTEVTVSQWFEFVQAYAPYYDWDASPLLGFVGSFIGVNGNLNDPSSYYYDDIVERYPMNMSWRMAARYCNWLHNGKAGTQEAFESGAYDVTTFTENPDGSYNDQITRSQGAQFWIPSLDEWMKGAHYDPTLNNGFGGWWTYPDSSNDPLIVGPPGVGQTNASAWTGTNPEFPVDVGQYPEIHSPWDLLDLSGGMKEWTEEIGNSLHTQRWIRGSSFFSDEWSYQGQDRIYRFQINFVWSSTMTGIRIASVVPAPAGASLLLVGSCCIFNQRRQRCTGKEL